MQNFEYEFDASRSSDEDLEEVGRRKNYSRRKSVKSAKRRSRKAPTNKPSCGMSARRNHRWSW